MSLRDDIPVEPMAEADWRDVERAVMAELEVERPSASVPAPRSGARWLAIVSSAAGAIAVAAALALWLRADPAPSGLQTSRFEAQSEPVRATVGDVAIELGAHGAVVVVGSDDEGWVTTLERGRASFSVPPRQARAPFVVQAANVRVEVVGTGFTVTRDDAEVSVDVEHGIVRVTHRGRALRLTAGQRWSTSGTEEPPTIEAAQPTEDRVEPAVEGPVAAPRSERTERAPPSDTPAGSASDSARDSVGASASSADAARETFERASSLETTHPARAIALYARVARSGGAWAPAALFAQGRLELERGHRAEARRLLRRYLQRYPSGINATDARRLLE